MSIINTIMLFRLKKSNDISKKAMVAKNVSVNNSTIGHYVNLAHDSAILDSTIGQRTSIGRYTNVRHSDVGRYSTVSWNVTIGADGHPIDRISGNASFFQTRFGLCSKNISKGEVPRTRVGHDVWIGCNAIIKSGVTIGNGAVIGAGAVVLKDVLPYEVVGGYLLDILNSDLRRVPLEDCKIFAGGISQMKK